jgi:hypothetical protein
VTRVIKRERERVRKTTLFMAIFIRQYCLCLSDSDDDMVFDLDERRLNSKEASDDDEEDNNNGITHRGVYQMAKRHSEASLDDSCLAHTFNPEEEYYRMYTKLGDIHFDPLKESNHTTSSVIASMSEEPLTTQEGVAGILSSENCKSMADESDRLFVSSGGDLTPREVVTGLSRYNNAIRFESDFERKREWIRRYELHKFDFDSDNREDAEKAYFASDDARNETYPLRMRLHYYQVAIKYTNDMREKKKRWDEYLAFCHSRKRS